MTRHIPDDVTRQLHQRAGSICECCGAAGVPDRHHLIPFALGGGHELENLLLLCPTCHRQIPKCLSLEQQRELQNWASERLGAGNISATSQLRGIEPSIDMGTVIFRNVNTVLRVLGQNVLTLHKEASGIYMNLVMLERFTPRLMVLSNRVIVNNGFRISMGRDTVTVADNSGNTQFSVKAANILQVRGKMMIGAEPFCFDDDGFRFRVLRLEHTVIDCALQDDTALDVRENDDTLNFGGATIRLG